MKLTDICIKRPIFAIVLNLVIILAGILCYFSLSMRYFPNVTAHSLRIVTNYYGADAKLIANEVNAVVEEQLADISGVDAMTSTATSGTGSINMTFTSDVDFAEKANEVRDKVAAVRAKLPQKADPPVIQTNGGGNYIMTLCFSSSAMTPLQIRDYLQRFVIDRIAQISGVAEINIWGATKYAMRIWLSSQSMAAHEITVKDVQDALLANNVPVPLGKFESKTMSFPISNNTALRNAEDFNNLAIKNAVGNIIRLKDIGRAALGEENDSYLARFDGKPSVGFDIMLEDGANALQVAEHIKQELKSIAPTLPHDMKMVVGIDFSPFYQESVHEVYRSIFLAVLCVLCVIYLFLGNLRSVVIPVITIPICVIGVFIIIALCGFTVNILTLLAIVLSIGLVVDDAIVMLENIHRYIEKGSSVFQAALKGSGEIAFSVIAMTLTIVAVYAPIGFLRTNTAALFREFAFTLAGAVLISGFVALTLSPSLCALLLTNVKKENSYTHWLENTYEKIKARYILILTRALSHRRNVLIIGGIVAVIGLLVFYLLPSKFLPDENIGMVRGIYNTAPGSNIYYTSTYISPIEAAFKNLSGVERFAVFAWGNSFEIPVILKKNDREKSVNSFVIADALQSQLQNIIGLTGFVNVPQPFSFSEQGDHALELYLFTSAGYDDLYLFANKITSKLKRYSGFVRIDNDIKYDTQGYDVSINRNFAESAYVNADDINSTLSILLGGSHITDFFMNNRTYQVLVQAELRDITDPSVLEHFYVKNLFGKMVSLSGLVTITPTVTQSVLQHYNRLPATKIMIDLAPGTDLSSAVSYLQKRLPALLPEDMGYAFVGKAKQLLETNASMGWLFLLSIIFIYLVLTAQFESFIDPLIILFTVPCSIVGALVTLKLAGGSLNLYTEIGLITLVGLITKHGILITKFANDILAQGKSIKTAVIEAASIRLRPILMTTAAMILGVLPLVFATGAGASGRFEIGAELVGGLLLGTFFSLILVPVVYSYIKSIRKHL